MVSRPKYRGVGVGGEGGGEGGQPGGHTNSDLRLWACLGQMQM